MDQNEEAQPLGIHSIKIMSIDRLQHLETMTWYLDVTIEVSRDGEVLHTRHIGFEGDPSEDEMRAQLADLKADYDARYVREQEIAAAEAATKPALIGEVI